MYNITNKLMLFFYFATLGSVPLVKSLIDQVLAAHPGISLFHVGGDEVTSLVNDHL